MPRLSYIESFNMNVCLHSSLHMSETNAEKKNGSQSAVLHPYPLDAGFC